MGDNSNFKQKILNCLSSSEEFKINSRSVRGEIANQNKESINIFLDTIQEVLNNKNESSEAKFYALLFLKLTTEHQNPQLLAQLAMRKELFRNLEEQAAFDKDKEFPERGSKFFSSEPTDREKSSGSNYLALLLEVIKYWYLKYGPTDKSSSNPFVRLFRSLAEDQKVPFPKNFHFYKPKDQKPGENTTERLSKSPQQSQQLPKQEKQEAPLLQQQSQPSQQNRQAQQQIPQVKQPQSSQVKQEEKYQIQEKVLRGEELPKNIVQNTQQRQQQDINKTPTPQPRTEPERTSKSYNATESDDVKNAKQKINSLKMAFQSLQEVYDHNKVESVEVETLLLYYNDIKEIHKPFEETIAILLTAEDQQNVEVLAEIVPLSSQAADLEQNFKDYKEKRIEYPEHRRKALKLLEVSGSKPFETPGKEETLLEKHSQTKAIQNQIPMDNSKANLINKVSINSSKVDDTRRQIEASSTMQDMKSSSVEENKNIQSLKQNEVQKVVQTSQLNQKPIQDDSEPQKENKNTASFANAIEKPIPQESTKKNTPSSFKTNEQHNAFSSNFTVSQPFKNKFSEPNIALQNTESSELKPSGHLVTQQLTTADNKPSELRSEQSSQQMLPRSSKFHREEPVKRSGRDDLLDREETKKQEFAEEPRAKKIEEAKVPETKARESKTSQLKNTNQRRPIWDDKVETKEEPIMTSILTNETKKPVQPHQRRVYASNEDMQQIREEEKEKAKPQEIKLQEIKPLIEETKQGNTVKSQKSAPEDKEEEKNKKVMVQSLNPRLTGMQTDNQGPNRQSMTQSMKFDQSLNALRFSGDLKLMARSLKNARNHSIDLKKIHEGIKRSFAISQKKLPAILSEHHLADPVVLSKFEQELHLLRQENEMLRSTSNPRGVNSDSQDPALKQAVTYLQNQITDFQREIEHLKKKNDTLERSHRTLNESTNESVLSKLQMIEAENKALKKKIEEATTAKRIPEESRTLQDRIRELSDENEWLTNAMGNLKRENQSLNSKLVDLDDGQGSQAHLRLSDAHDSSKEEERIYANRATSKTELRNHKLVSDFQSPKPSLPGSQISPKGENFVGQYRSPDHELFWRGRNDQPSPIESQKNLILEQGTIDKHSTFFKDAEPHQPRESANLASWRKDFVSPRTHNVEIGKKYENKFEKGPTNYSGSNVVRYQQNISPKIDDQYENPEIDDQYETPEEDVGGVEDYHHVFGKKEHVPVKTHVYRGESGGNFGRGGTKVADRHIFSSHKVRKDDENEKENEINFWESVDNKKRVESGWNQAVPKKVNGRAFETEKRNPFESESEWSEELKGITVPTSLYIFEELNSHLLSAPSADSVFYFKMACLKSKCPIYEDDFIQIGASSSVIQDYSTGKNQLKLSLFFSNKTDEPITNFTSTLTEGLNVEVVAKPEKLESTITTNKQSKQVILVSFKTVPISCLKMNCRAVCAGQRLSFSLFLPTLLNKFMEFKYVDAEEFKSKWRMYSSNTLKTEAMQIDSAIVWNAHDFKKYFAYLVDLKPDDEYDFIDGKKSIKLGGVFELKEPGSEYALKLNFLPSQDFVFQIATPLKNTENAKFILQNLIFLFKK